MKLTQPHPEPEVSLKKRRSRMRARKNSRSQMRTRKKSRRLFLTSVSNWKLFLREMSPCKRTGLKGDSLKGPLDLVDWTELDLVDSMDQDIHWEKQQVVMMPIGLWRTLAAGEIFLFKTPDPILNMHCISQILVLYKFDSKDPAMEAEWLEQLLHNLQSQWLHLPQVRILLGTY